MPLPHLNTPHSNPHPHPPQVFVVHGARGESGVLVQLDFSKLHEPRCKGVEHAGSPSSDYELWAPSDHLGGQKCLLACSGGASAKAERYNAARIEADHLGRLTP